MHFHDTFFVVILFTWSSFTTLSSLSSRSSSKVSKHTFTSHLGVNVSSVSQVSLQLMFQTDSRSQKKWCCCEKQQNRVKQLMCSVCSLFAQCLIHHQFSQNCKAPLTSPTSNLFHRDCSVCSCLCGSVLSPALPSDFCESVGSPRSVVTFSVWWLFAVCSA